MFGFIHESIRQLVTRKHGEDAWTAVVERAGMEAGKECNVMHYYEDSETFRLVESVSAVAQMPMEEIWESYGGFLIQYTMESGWGPILKALASNLKSFLDNLDALHYFIDHVVYKADLRGPSFRCEVDESDDSLTLHYYSSRTGLFPIVKGVVREVARRVFRLSIDISMTGRTQHNAQGADGSARLEEHVTFKIVVMGDFEGSTMPASSVMGALTPMPGRAGSPGSATVPKGPPGACPFPASSRRESVRKRRDSTVIEVTPVEQPPGSPQLPRLTQSLLTVTNNPNQQRSPSRASTCSHTSFSEHTLHHDPDFEGPLTTVTVLDFAEMCPYHVVFDKTGEVLQCGAAMARHFNKAVGVPITSLFDLQRPQINLDFGSIMNFINAVFVLRMKRGGRAVKAAEGKDRKPLAEEGLLVKGQMVLLTAGDKILFIGSPYLTTIPELIAAGLHINSLPIRDVTRDLILLNQQRLAEVEAHRQLEEQTAQVESMKAEVEREREKAEALLREVLPPSVAAQLMEGKAVEAAEFPDVTVLFSDLPNFQHIVPASQPTEIVALLDDLFTRFDRLVEHWGLYKVETVGDSYMVVGGAPEPMLNHAEVVGYLALGMLWEARAIKDPLLGTPLQVRVGFHSGAIVAGVVGAKMPRFCLFGDTVNTASRMESHGRPGRIHVSQASRDAADKTGRFIFQERGQVTIKGKGLMSTHWLVGSKKRSLWEVTDRPRGEDDTIDGYEELNQGLPALGEEGPAELAKKELPKPYCANVSSVCVLS